MTDRLRVAAFTQGRTLSGPRFRVTALVSALARLGIDVTEYPAVWQAYPPRGKTLRPVWGIGAITTRAADLIRAHIAGSDVSLLQREFISTYSTLEGLAPAPRVLDVDDAIYLHRGGRMAKRLAEQAAVILAGNSIVAERFRAWNRNVKIVPTALDTERWRPAAAGGAPERPVILWSGQGGGLVDWEWIEPAIAQVLRRHPTAVARVISNWQPNRRHIPDERFEFIEWTPAVEVAMMQTATVGVMPLVDNDWNRGKCSLKALQYLACGLPAVMSPVGMNADVLAQAECGLGPTSESEWVTMLDALVADPARCAALGRSGRALVVERYSIEAVSPIVASALREACGR